MPRGGGMGGGFGGGRGFGGGFGGGHRHHHHHIHPRRRVGGLFGFGLLPFVTGAAVGASMASGSSYREPETVVYVQQAPPPTEYYAAYPPPQQQTTAYPAPTAPRPHPQASHEPDYVNVNYGPPPEYSQYPPTLAAAETKPGSVQNAPPPYSAEAPAPYSAEAPALYPVLYPAESPVYESVPETVQIVLDN